MSLPLEICINTIENYVSNFSNGISLKKKKDSHPNYIQNTTLPLMFVKMSINILLRKVIV